METETSNSSENPGGNIMRAARVIRRTHEETSRLFEILDDLFASQDWSNGHHRSHKKWLGMGQTGAQLGQPENWFATKLQRAYMPGVEDENAHRRILIIEVNLAPDHFEEPTLAAIAIHLDEPVTRDAFWPAWQWSTSGDWYPPGSFGNVAVDPERLKRLVKGIPSKGHALVTPLCELNRSNVAERVVNPLLALERSLGS